MSKDQQNEEQRISVKEFQAWLSGVLEMQDDDWTPSKAQWDKILKKIMSLQDVPLHPVPAVNYQQYPQGPARYAPQHQPVEPQYHVDQYEDSNKTIVVENSTMGSTLAFSPVPLTNTPSALATDGVSNVKTPNIDTSGGTPYLSSFM